MQKLLRQIKDVIKSQENLELLSGTITYKPHRQVNVEEIDLKKKNRKPPLPNII